MCFEVIPLLEDYETGGYCAFAALLGCFISRSAWSLALLVVRSFR